MPLLLQAVLTFGLVVCLPFAEWLKQRERFGNNALLIWITSHKFPTACALGAVAVLLNVVLPFATQPFPPEEFELAWWHPEMGTAETAFPHVHTWESGESVKIVNIPEPPGAWLDFEGLVLLYVSRSKAAVTMETAFSYTNHAMRLTSPVDGRTADDVFATGIRWDSPWGSGIIINGAISPHDVRLTRLSR